MIADKLAEYVARNGRDFEEGIIAKRDPRFGFVERGNQHHIYYLWQCRAKEQEIEERVKREPTPISKTETSTRLGTVSFKVFKVRGKVHCCGWVGFKREVPLFCWSCHY